ncbi:MAG TPA: cytochrome c-type biogenesis protein CcmH [Actinomycetota bacterium]|nr:cytochrome c-type biogenesis protein CcmH [Actinomycetota bacterium]
MTARAVALALAAVVLTAAPAPGAPEDVANDVAREVMSPYCPGVTLHDCPSRNADELRRDIAAWAAAGTSRAEIMDRLESEFGPSIRAVPERSGAGLLAWLLPAVAVVAGVAAALALARRFARARPAAGAAEAPARDDERRRLAAELDALRSER